MNVYRYMSRALIFVLAALAFILTDISSAYAGDLCIDDLGEPGREAVCRLVNKAREKLRRSPLALDETLSKVAQRHADDMFRRRYFSHVAPGGVTLSTRLRRGEARYGRAGENIARGQRTELIVMKAWMGSPGHRANILQSGYRRIGIGRTGNIWVQVFTD